MDLSEKTALISSESIRKRTGLSVAYATMCIVDVFGVFPLVALPYAIIKCGFLGIPLIILICGLQIYTAILLGRCWLLMEDVDPSIRSKRRYPYSALAQAAYGKTVAAFITFLVNIGIFSASIPNLIVASQNLQLLGENVGGGSVKISYCSWIIIVGVAICPFLWLGSPKDIKHLSTLSGIIVLSVFGLILFNMLIVTQETSDKRPLFTENFSLWEILLSAYGMLTFQFDIHPTILNIHLDMKNRKSIGKALIGAYSDFTWKRCVVRTLLTIITIIVSESVPRFDLVMSFVGAALTGPLAFIFPPLFYLRIARKTCSQQSVLIMTHPFRNESPLAEKNITINQEKDKSTCEIYFCVVIVIIGLLMTGLSTYHNFVTNIQYLTFSPPCIYNFTT
ncbi:amino acid transporter AVT1G isoform X2 [Agrilus planipennis]|uniref:Amino acid transporter AVT1G isoform X2 n=1 Tax=Agrilus planipennis TaxID=224129 RepID=A0A1W4XEV8_AGRPL|nr:amino acid transporter AVT1G isoform X2 [Agrilus planipennis]